MQPLRAIAACLLCVAWLHAAAFDDNDPYLGYFSAEIEGVMYSVNIERFDATSYDGIFKIGDERFQFEGRRFGEQLGVRLANETRQLQFRGNVQGAALILHAEDGQRFVLYRGSPE